MIKPGRWHPLADGLPPAWASGWGEDEYGVWVEISVSGVTQKLRWIESGSFVMGSPDDEPGRLTEDELQQYKDHTKEESPQHTVTLTQGYWLFDTPVTQALYAVVIGDNPSRFKSAQRPVEKVSWHDAQIFMQRLNQTLPGLGLSLPSEAQWEYACRAGSTEATYAGAMNILGARNAPVLDPIAWYGGNSGVEFDLEDGEDSSDWPDKQYPHTLAGTRQVAQKKANNWGLYDLLGNVWEWCEDGLRDYGEQAIHDSRGSEEDGAGRVLRGGSWSSYARDVRCAYRIAGPPEYASNGTGVRCARVHEPEAGSERRRRPTTRVAEQRGVDDTDRGD